MNTPAALALLAAFVSLAAPLPASARPAVVRVFEADARAEPSPDAAVVHRFAERTEVSVSEESKDGWRRVRLPDGGTAWIEDAAVTFGEPLVVGPAPSTAAPPPLAAPPPPTASVTKPDLRPRLFVEDATQLPRLMEKDPKFGAEAQSLVNRRTGAFVAGGLGLASFVALAIAGASNMDTPPPGDPNFGQMPSGPKYFAAGMVTLLVGGLVAALVYPKRGEVVDLVNGWNIAHPDQQLSVEPRILVPMVGGTEWSSGAAGAPAPSMAEDTGTVLVIPATGGPPVMAIPTGGGTYLPATGGPPVLGTPIGP